MITKRIQINNIIKKLLLPYSLCNIERGYYRMQVINLNIKP